MATQTVVHSALKTPPNPFPRMVPPPARTVKPLARLVILQDPHRFLPNPALHILRASARGAFL